MKIGTIISNTKKLAATDYKVVKCMEAKLMDEPMPYDVDALIKERNGYREAIREAKKQLKSK